MALTVATNTGALTAQAAASSVNKEMETAMERLATGQRINSASDDAAGVAIASRMNAQIKGMNQAIRNASDGQALASTAEGAMIEIESMLQRMRELAVQSSNGTLTSEDRINLNNEMVQLKSEIDRVAGSASFNGIKLLDGSADVKLAIGASASETLSFSVGSLKTSSLGTAATAATSSAVLEARAQGTAAQENVVNLSFNGADSYSFKIVLADASGSGSANKEIAISNISVPNGDAAAIASQINNEVLTNHGPNGSGGADLRGVLTASAQGGTVVLTAKDGSKIDIKGFASAGGGVAVVNPVTNSSASSITLENDTQFQNIGNTGGIQASATTATLQFDDDAKYQFRLNGELVNVDLVGANSGDTTTLKAAVETVMRNTAGVGNYVVTQTDIGTEHILKITDSKGRDIDISGLQKVTSSAVPDGYLTIDTDGTGSGAGALTVSNGEFLTADQNTGTGLKFDSGGATGTVSFSNQDLVYKFKLNTGGSMTEYTVDGATRDFQAELTRVAAAITSDAGAGTTAVNRDGVLEITVATGGTALSFSGGAALSSPGIDAVTEGDVYFKNGASGGSISSHTALTNGSMVTADNGTVAVASEMTLNVQGDDTYSFNIDANGGNGSGSDASISATVVGGNLSGLINSINAHSSSTGIIASDNGGSVLLKKADGSAFALNSFVADNNGKIIAANASGQGSGKILENNGDGDTATVAATTQVTKTEMDLTFSTKDDYSFQISNGVSTAIVRSTSASGGSTSDLKTEIISALNQANISDIKVSGSGTTGTLTLVHKLGGEVNVTNFKSDGTGTVVASPKSGQGAGLILNDDPLGGTAKAAIGSTDITSVGNAQIAMEAIDRALSALNAERANLGAISNRLDSTVASLTNTSVEMQGALGRITDADFASETSVLAKTQILQQASMAMLAQANAAKQNVLSLLQG